MLWEEGGQEEDFFDDSNVCAFVFQMPEHGLFGQQLHISFDPSVRGSSIMERA